MRSLNSVAAAAAVSAAVTLAWASPKTGPKPPARSSAKNTPAARPSESAARPPGTPPRGAGGKKDARPPAGAAKGADRIEGDEVAGRKSAASEVIRSPCDVEDQHPSCQTLHRLATFAVLAANAESGAGNILARKICGAYLDERQAATRIATARGMAQKATSSDSAGRHSTASRLPQAMDDYASFCEALLRGDPPSKLAMPAACAVVLTSTGERVTLADALGRAYAVVHGPEVVEPPAPNASPPRPPPPLPPSSPPTVARN